MAQKKERISLPQINSITAPEGREVMVVGAGYWGRGKDGRAALKAARASSGLGKIQGQSLLVFEVAAGAYVDDNGGICYASGERSREVLRGIVTRVRDAKN